MNEEEKQAIKDIEKTIQFYNKKPERIISVTVDNFDVDILKTVLNLITKLEKENEELNKKNYLCTPEIPQCQHGKYINYSDLIDKIIIKDKEIEEKDKQIDLMAKTISLIYSGVDLVKRKIEESYCEFLNSNEDCCWKTDKHCKDCVKQYFEKLAKGE